MPTKGKEQPKQTQSQQPRREYKTKPRPKAEDAAEQHPQEFLLADRAPALQSAHATQ
jgi:hypothetical protein